LNGTASGQRAHIGDLPIAVIPAKLVPAKAGSGNPLYENSKAVVDGDHLRAVSIQPDLVWSQLGTITGDNIRDRVAIIGLVPVPKTRDPSETDLAMMRLALLAAEQAAEKGEVPVGSVVARGGEILAVAANEREATGDPTAHAELLAIRRAAATIGSWRLTGCTLYATLEPCPMCAGALVNARVPRLVYGCDDPKAGAVRSLYRLCDDERLNHRLQVASGVLADECAAVLREFFQAQRAMGKK